jgi:hypothetical protein
MIVYRVTQTGEGRGLYGCRRHRYTGCNEWWYQTFKRNTHPNMRFGSISKEVALGFIEHALDIDRIFETTELTITVYDVPDQFVVVNPRLRPVRPLDVISSECVFFPNKGRVVSRRVACAKEFVNERSSVG